jgi:hypothetical protein
MKGGQIGVRHRLGFRLQDTPEREVQRFKLANMVANLRSPEFRQQLFGWSWWCGTALNLLKDIFLVRIHPVDPGDHILSQMLLVDVGVDLFACGKQPSTT